MFSRSIRRSILDTKFTPSALPPTFLLPIRARYLQTTTQHVESPANGLGPLESASKSVLNELKPVSAKPNQQKEKPLSRGPARSPDPITTPLVLDSSIKEMLPLLTAQPSHYVNIHIHGKPYLVTAGDTVRLPFHMPNVIPGDVLRLNRAATLGSRDFTLKGTPYIDERIFECRARVMGVESEPLRIKEKKKRRNRRIHTVKSKLRFTILKISELKIKSLEQLEIIAKGTTTLGL